MGTDVQRKTGEDFLRRAAAQRHLLHFHLIGNAYIHSKVRAYPFRQSCRDIGDGARGSGTSASGGPSMAQACTSVFVYLCGPDGIWAMQRMASRSIYSLFFFLPRRRSLLRSAGQPD
jgi:hypothetical protein